MIGEAPRRCGSLSGRLKGADKETYNLAFGTCHIITTPLFFLRQFCRSFFFLFLSLVFCFCFPVRYFVHPVC